MARRAAVLSVLLAFAPVIVWAEEADPNIYQVLWDLDLQHNGCSTAANDGDNADAHVLIEERTTGTGGPLFTRVDADRLSRPTYTALAALFDNYNYRSNEAEDPLGNNSVEDQERREFLEAVVATEVGQQALEYINSSFGYAFDEESFEAELERIWFESYTNYVSGRRTPDAVGFEHVFVGESQSDPNSGQVGGYHSWLKFYLDEKAGSAKYLKSNYSGAPGVEFPNVATITFRWDPDGDGPLPLQQKPTGGFFVGPSPELQLMLGTVAFYESVDGQFSSKDKKRVTLNGAKYDLVLYRESLEGSSNGNNLRGDQVRSFFPIFVGQAESGSGGTGHNGDGMPPTVRGDVQITRAMINSSGNDPPGSEWIEVRNNTGEAVDLNGWRLKDAKGRTQQISGLLLPNEAREISVTRSGEWSLQLTNSGGTIAIINPAGEVVDTVGYGSSDEGEVVSF